MKKQTLTVMAVALGLTAAAAEIDQRQCDGYMAVHQPNGPVLGYNPSSGCTLLEVDGLVFKDLDRDGKLSPFEDWRLSANERATDLAGRLSEEEIAGLMLYSSHQAVVGTPELTEPQRQFLINDGVRHVLLTHVDNAEMAARWSNNIQALVEGLGHGIPANNSSDPRHNSRSDAEFSAGGGGDISMWPGTLGMAATFDPSIIGRFGEIVADEYRAMGLTTALFPQVDIATDPRWYRFGYTLGEDPVLVTDLARAYTDGLQTSHGDKEIADGWGYGSINAMIKHWPGSGAAGEGARDGHYCYGAYAVFPTGNFDIHTDPFVKGAMQLNGPTKSATAVMPDYTVCAGIDPENVANGFSKYLLDEILRQKAGFNGVICTDWHITADNPNLTAGGGRPFGVWDLSIPERHYKCIMAGVDQFGGNNDKGPVLEAFQIMKDRHGEEFANERIRLSAHRLLMNIFRTGLFENPYLDIDHARATVGKPEYMQEAYDAQLKSVVMLKNHNATLPAKEGLKVYIPKRTIPAYMDFWYLRYPEREVEGIPQAVASKFFTIVDTPEEADMAIVGIESPFGTYGYDFGELEEGDNGYRPISVQYSPYTADTAREKSLAGGDPYTNNPDRNYRGKSSQAVNHGDLDLVINTRKAMGDKPVVVIVNTTNPFVAEFEPYADAILLGFDVQRQALLEVMTGKTEPSAMLPFQMPADMLTVEGQAEDKPRDMRCYTDADGNTYDFGFGLNWSGPINDARYKAYH